MVAFLALMAIPAWGLCGARHAPRPILENIMNLSHCSLTGHKRPSRKRNGRPVKFGSFIALLGKKDCLYGIPPRLDNATYLKAYGKQYELEAKLTANDKT